jgi:hypothetical protein
MVMSTTVPIKVETLKAFANEARRLGEVETELSTAEMLSVFESAPKEKDIPSAEEAKFGTLSEAVLEYSIIANNNVNMNSDAKNNNVGCDIVINEAISLKGFRICGYDTGAVKVQLWDPATLELVAEATVNVKYTNNSTWYESFISIPVNLVKGKTYTLAHQANYSPMRGGNTTVTYNSKVTYLAGLKRGPINECPTESYTNQFGHHRPLISLIMEEPLAGDEIFEYKVLTETMDDIADEVKRITGASGRLSTEQIKTALQGIASNA